MKNYRVNVRLGEQHYQALRRIAKYLDCSFSQVVRATILRYEQQNNEVMPFLKARAARRQQKESAK